MAGLFSETPLRCEGIESDVFVFKAMFPGL